MRKEKVKQEAPAVETGGSRRKLERNLSRMSRLRIAFLLTLTLALGSRLITASSTRTIDPITPFPLVQPAGDSIEFIVEGDQRPTGLGKTLPRALYQMMDEIALLRPNFVLSVGDIVWGYGDTKQRFLNELDLYQSIVNKTGVPIFNAPGNHEVHGSAEAYAILESRYKRLYGSFDYGASHFIVLNTEEVGHEGFIDGAQREWLEADLEANKNAKHIFCLMHRPMYGAMNPDFDPMKKQSFKTKQHRDELHRLFLKYPVHMVLAGHEHLFHQEEHDGIRYITSGGGGAPLYAEPPDGGYSHYVVVKVKGDKISTQVVEPFHLEVTYTAGNDGFEPSATARVTNSAFTFMRAGNLTFRLPRVSETGHYEVTAVLKNFQGQVIELHPVVRGAVDNHDGSATVSVAVDMPASSTSYVTVQSFE